MKNIVLTLLIFASFSGYSQVTITSSNPTLVSTGDTYVNEISMDRDYFNQYLPRAVPLLIRMPSTNSGTIKINTFSSDMDSSPSYAAGAVVWITIVDRFWIQQSNGSDSIEISW